jgi:hypothetical protein
MQTGHLECPVFCSRPTALRRVTYPSITQIGHPAAALVRASFRSSCGPARRRRAPPCRRSPRRAST